MEMNISAFLPVVAAVHGQRPAVSVGRQLFCSYAGLHDRVRRLAASYGQSFGLRKGDRVAVAMRNSPQYFEILLACWHAGIVAVPMNAKLHPKEVAYILDHTESRVCFVSEDLKEGVVALKSEVATLAHVVCVDDDDYEALVQVDPAPIVATAENDPAWLFYTSGTTGRPKGVTLTQKNVMAATLNYFSDVDAIAPGEAIIHAAPMSHGSGFYVLPHVARAGLNVVPESGGFDAAEIYALLRAHRGVSLFAAPTMVKRLVDHPIDADTRNLKTIVYGGGPMYVADCKAALARFGYKLAQIYGQGESPMTITAMGKAIHADTGHPRFDARLASVGHAFIGLEVRVGDGEDRPLPVGEIGEILVRGDPVMPGYWDNPEASADTLRNGWLHTGDLGSLDADGFLTLKDRSKDVIISGGANIYPREVEEVLLRHPRVSEVSVVGRQDPEWGEVVIAFVVPRGPAGAPPDQAELDALCLDHIARFKRPKAYRFIDALPKNSTGKVLKTELRKLLQRP